MLKWHRQANKIAMFIALYVAVLVLSQIYGQVPLKFNTEDNCIHFSITKKSQTRGEWRVRKITIKTKKKLLITVVYGLFPVRKPW